MKAAIKQLRAEQKALKKRRRDANLNEEPLETLFEIAKELTQNKKEIRSAKKTLKKIFQVIIKFILDRIRKLH